VLTKAPPRRGLVLLLLQPFLYFDDLFGIRSLVRV